MLCNSEGAVVRQWKWDELEDDDLHKLTKDLSVNVAVAFKIPPSSTKFTKSFAVVLFQLNDHLKLEYVDSTNIKLSFVYGKEQVSLDLSPVKDNQSKIQDLVRIGHLLEILEVALSNETFFLNS